MVLVVGAFNHHTSNLGLAISFCLIVFVVGDVKVGDVCMFITVVLGS